MENEGIVEFQDLGDVQQKIRLASETGPSGVSPLVPDDDGSHLDALEEIRSIIDDNYGESIDNLAGDEKEVVVERIILTADDLPYIEYTLIDKME